MLETGVKSWVSLLYLWEGKQCDEKFRCVFGCVYVELGGVCLSLLFLAFGKDLNYVNNRHHGAVVRYD